MKKPELPDNIAINLKPLDVPNCHASFNSFVKINQSNYPICAGKFNLFIPNLFEEWGLKILKHWPLEKLENDKVILLDKGCMKHAENSSKYQQLKIQELIDLHNILYYEHLGPQALNKIIKIQFIDNDNYNECKKMVESERWNGNDNFFGFPVKTYKRKNFFFKKYSIKYRKFKQRLEVVCIKNNISRRGSTQNALTEFNNNNNISLTNDGYRLIDIDLANSFGPRIHNQDWIKNYISVKAQFPPDRRNAQYQSYKLDNQSIPGGRASCDNRMSQLGISKDIFYNKTVLDLGCNIGGFCFYCQDNGAKYTMGVDINTDAIEGAKLLRDYRKITNMDFFSYSFENKIFSNIVQQISGLNKFDVIFAMSIIGHVKKKNYFMNYLKL